MIFFPDDKAIPMTASTSERSKIENSSLPASTGGRVDFTSSPFIQVFPFIRDLRVHSMYILSVHLPFEV